MHHCLSKVAAVDATAQPAWTNFAKPAEDGLVYSDLREPGCFAAADSRVYFELVAAVVVVVVAAAAVVAVR